MAGSGEGPLGVISILPVGHSSRHDPTAPPLSESLHRIDSSGQGSAKLVMQPPNSGRNTGDEFLIGM